MQCKSSCVAIDAELDAIGLACPLPLVHAKQRLQMMLPGQVLHLITSDPSSVIDVTVFVATVGYNLIETNVVQGRYSFLIQKVD